MKTQQLKEDKKNLDFILSNYKDITHTRLGETSIYDDLKNVRACVVYTSTSGVVVYVRRYDLCSLHTRLVFHINGGKLSEIEDPCLNDRENYITHYNKFSLEFR